MQATLRELTQHQLELKATLDAKLEATEGEITEEIETLLRRELQTEGSIKDKLSGYGYIIDEYRAEAAEYHGRADSYQARVDRIRKRGDVAENMADSLKSNIHTYLKLAEIDRVETDDYIFRRQANGGPRGAVVEVNTSELPGELIRVRTSADKRLISGFMNEHDIELLLRDQQQGLVAITDIRTTETESGIKVTNYKRREVCSDDSGDLTLGDTLDVSEPDMWGGGTVVARLKKRGEHLRIE